MKVLQIEGFNNIDVGTMDYEEEHIVLYNFLLSEAPYSKFLFRNRTEGVMSGVLCMGALAV